MTHSLLKKLGENVRTLRRRKGLSQEDFAELTGLHRTYIGGVERGERNVSVLNLARIAQALDISVSELVKGIDKTNQ